MHQNSIINPIYMYIYIYISAKHRLDITLAAGKIFNLHFDCSLFFSAYQNEADANMTSTFALDHFIFFKAKSDTESYTVAKIISMPMIGSVIYSI